MINNIIKMGMNIALDQARKAFDMDEVPVGACLFYKNECVAQAHNTMHHTGNPLLHAECLVMQQALQTLSLHDMRDSTLFVTLEPCCMCAGAIELVGISRVYFGAYDAKMGQIDHNHRVLRHSAIQALGGYYAHTCGALLTRFFQEKRIQNS